MGAYIGAFIRVGFQYYRGGGPGPGVGFTVMYAQILGCFIMGLVCEFQGVLMAGPRLHKLLYIFIATGLCGSITTFSTWAYESNKLALQQLDSGYGGVGNNYHQGRTLQWLLSLWEGVLIPLAALHAGQHVSQAYKARIAAAAAAAAADTASSAAAAGVNPSLPCPTLPPSPLLPPPWHARAELGILVVYLATTASVVAIPLAYGWSFLCYTGVLGAVGAFTRFKLAPYNKALPSLLTALPPLKPLLAYLEVEKGRFPLGTFLANALGTLVLALAMYGSKFAASYHDIPTQSLLYGVSTGFAGCLTTMSTFVLELHTLPRPAGYFYGAVSMAVGQLWVAAIFESTAAPLAALAYPSALAPGGVSTVSPCLTFPALCTSFFDAVACPSPVTLAGCRGGDTTSLVGYQCSCGGLDISERLAELVIDVQVKGNISASLVPVFPHPLDTYTGVGGGGGGTPTLHLTTLPQPLEAFDYCLSFENLCDHALNVLACPPASRAINACSRGGLPAFVGLCSCGGFNLPGLGNGVEGRVAELLVDHALLRRYDFVGLRGYPIEGPRPLDFCGEVAGACQATLRHWMCPPAQRRVVGCGVAGDLTTFEGECTCFGRPGPASNRVPQVVMDSFMKPNILPLFVRTTRSAVNASTTLDACATFTGICTLLQDSIGCPPATRTNVACNSSSRVLEEYLGECTCGGGNGVLDRLMSTRVKEYVIDYTLAADLEGLALIPPTVTPYALMASSTPFKQLLAPLYPLPGSNL